MPDYPDEIYRALVVDLAHSVVPTTIMGLTILAIGGYVYATVGTLLALSATIAGCIASISKIALTVRHRLSGMHTKACRVRGGSSVFMPGSR